MFVERAEPVSGYVIQRFGAVTLAMSTRLRCFDEIEETAARPSEPAKPAKRRRLRSVPRNIILGSHESEADAP